MTRFLVEVPHEATKEACDQAIKSFLETGSHFFTNADWGCEDGEHKAWFIMEIDDRESVLQILPLTPAAQPRSQACENIPPGTSRESRKNTITN